MKKIFLLAALALPLSVSLTACGGDTVNLINTPGTTTPKYANAVVHAVDGTSTVTATKSTGTAGDSWASSGLGYATFTFNTLPGSDAINIVGYRIIKDTINGADVTPTDTSYKNISIYVPSGYACSTQTTLAQINQSCDASLTTTTPATGITSTAFSLNLAGPLYDYVVSTNATAYRVTDIEFLGVSSRNEKILIEANNVTSVGIKAGVN